MRSVFDTVDTDYCTPSTQTIGQDEHRLLLNTYQSSLTQSHQNTEIAIRCVGALGQVAMRRTISSEENYAIGTALLTPLNAEQMSRLTGGNVGEIDLISQILDTLFDVYGEETREYDGNVERLGIVRILESILPTFRRLVSCFLSRH